MAAAGVAARSLVASDSSIFSGEVEEGEAFGEGGEVLEAVAAAAAGEDEVGVCCELLRSLYRIVIAPRVEDRRESEDVESEVGIV